MDISGIDIYHLVKEIQSLVGSKVQKAYGNDDYPLILDMYGFKYRYIYVDLPDILRFSNEKGKMPQKPPGFVERSRKHLQGLRVKSVSQNDIDRIIVIELEGRLYRKLIIELFAKGNMIICDENNRMLTVLRQESYASREIKSGKQYSFPPRSSNIIIDDYKSFKESLLLNGYNHALSAIAQLGYGGKYAEETLRFVLKSSFEPKTLIKDIEEAQINSIYERLIDYKNSNFYEIKKDNMNDSIIVNPDKKESNSIVDLLTVVSKSTEIVEVKTDKEDKKDKIVRMQKERAEKLSSEAESMQKAGSLIFEKYEDIRLALEFAKSYKKKNGSLKGLKEAWPNNLPKLLKISDDSRTIEIDL